jgi:hypothetical protein
LFGGTTGDIFGMGAKIGIVGVTTFETGRTTGGVFTGIFGSEALAAAVKDTVTGVPGGRATGVKRGLDLEIIVEGTGAGTYPLDITPVVGTPLEMIVEVG